MTSLTPLKLFASENHQSQTSVLLAAPYPASSLLSIGTNCLLTTQKPGAKRKQVQQQSSKLQDLMTSLTPLKLFALANHQSGTPAHSSAPYPASSLPSLGAKRKWVRQESSNKAQKQISSKLFSCTAFHVIFGFLKPMTQVKVSLTSRCGNELFRTCQRNRRAVNFNKLTKGKLKELITYAPNIETLTVRISYGTRNLFYRNAKLLTNLTNLRNLNLPIKGYYGKDDNPLEDLSHLTKLESLDLENFCMQNANSITALTLLRALSIYAPSLSICTKLK